VTDKGLFHDLKGLFQSNLKVVAYNFTSTNQIEKQTFTE